MTCPSVGFFENTLGVAEHAKIQGTKETIPPMTDTIARDMDSLGYCFEFQRVDSQMYLVRQRRNRIWGTANLQSENSDGYGERMHRSMTSMESGVHFQYTKCFDPSLPSAPLTGENAKMHLATALKKASLMGQSVDDVFIDCSTSKGRMNPEMALGVSTCTRPSHKIYCNRFQRYLTAKEHWLCQGLFQDDFQNPAAVQHLLDCDDTLARDLAGRAPTYDKRHIYIYIYMYV